MEAQLIIGLIFLPVGLLMIFSGCYVSNKTNAFKDSAEKTNGEVIGHQVSTGSKGGKMYTAQVLFLDRNGKPIEFLDSYASNPPSPKLGKTVKVLYDPLNPSNAKIDSFMSLYLVPVLLWFLGTIFSLLATVFLTISN